MSERKISVAKAVEQLIESDLKGPHWSYGTHESALQKQCLVEQMIAEESVEDAIERSINLVDSVLEMLTSPAAVEAPGYYYNKQKVYDSLCRITATKKALRSAKAKINSIKVDAKRVKDRIDGTMITADSTFMEVDDFDEAFK